MRSVSVQIIAVKTAVAFGAFTACSLFASLPAHAQHAASASSPVLPLDMVLTERDLRRLEFPAKALENGTSGIVLAQCSAEASGEVSGCTILEEAPTGQFFGAESLRVLRNARLPQVDEPHEARHFRVVIPFALQGSPVPQLQTPIE